jgi:hypothetical protein
LEARTIAAQPGRVEERHGGEIEREEPGAVQDQLVEGVIERLNGCGVDVAGDRQQPDVGVVNALFS